MPHEKMTNNVFNDVKKRAESLNFTIQSCKEERDSRKESYDKYMSDYMTLRESGISDIDIDSMMLSDWNV